MKVKLLSNVVDGKTGQMLKSGEVIDIEDVRGYNAINMGVAEKVEEIRTAVPEIKTKKAVRKSTKKSD
jgi:hypothetical protein